MSIGGLLMMIASGLGALSPASGSRGSTLLRILSLRDYNTRIVLTGSLLLGVAAGIVGTYMVLRRRALIGDALSHATLPGIAAAFIITSSLGGTGKSLPILLLGGTISGMIGVGLILLIRRLPRIREDAALGIVLSVMFGLGIALLGIVQKMPTGQQAGLESFIFGKTASMVAADAILIAVAAGVVVLACTLLAKEFAVLSFDADFARTQGWPVGALDLVMMLLVTTVIVIGLQAVGLILVIALLIIPAAAARFWTDHLRNMLVVGGAIGGISGLLGAALSATAPRLPAGAIIVLTAASIFVVSLLLGRRRGLLVRVLARVTLARRTARQHLLRATYERLETSAGPSPDIASIPLNELEETRSWSRAHVRRTLRRAASAGLVIRENGNVRLTTDGLTAARRVVRNHRLWEMYLITYADIAPSHVDRDADAIEHVLGPAMIHELETLVDASVVPPSPHPLAGAAA